MYVCTYYFRLNDVLDAESGKDIYIIPPNDGQLSDKESGDEEENLLEHLPKRLLASQVESNDTDGSDSDSEEIIEPVKKKGRKFESISCYSDELEVFTQFNTVKDFSNIEMSGDDPIDYFNIFFNDDVWQFIYDQTTQYSGHLFTMGELKATFGVLLASGTISQNRRRDYWSSSELKRNIAITKSISINKFESIFASLHFVPIDVVPSGDKYQKVRLIIEKLNKLFLQYAPLTNAFSIDEAMVPYYGRHGCKQHIKGKPIRFGFKWWCLATPSGYLLQLQPYPGKAEKATEDYDFGASGNVIYYFAKILRARYPDNHQITITMDNYFTNLKLFKHLKVDLNITATGTIRKNRVPSNPFDYGSMKKSKRGSIKAVKHNDSKVNLSAWNDNTVVTVASNCVSVNPIQGKVYLNIHYLQMCYLLCYNFLNLF